MIEVIMKRS